MGRSRSAGHNISNKGITITNSVDADGVKLLSVKKCHSIPFVWTYDPDVSTIGGHYHTWKVRNIIKLSLGISQGLRK